MGLYDDKVCTWLVAFTGCACSLLVACFYIYNTHDLAKILGGWSRVLPVLCRPLRMRWVCMRLVVWMCTWGARLLTPVFGMIINLYKMISNGEVLYMKKLGIVNVNIFVV